MYNLIKCELLEYGCFMVAEKYIKFIPHLTKRELEVIEAVLAGSLRYKSIASSLNISVNTVKTHLRKIYLTVEVNNIEALATLFHGYSQNKAEITPQSPLKISKSPQIGDMKQHIFAVILYNIIHSGGKNMQNFKSLKVRTGFIISLISVIALVIGFAAIKLFSGNRQTDILNNFNFAVDGTSEGIKLSIKNIPEDAYSLFINIIDITDGQEDEALSTNVYIWDNDLSKNELSKLKQTGYLICPFVKKGNKYLVNIAVYTVEDYKNNFDTVRDNYLTRSASVIAGGGIYLTNSPTLNFTDNNTTVTLSETPKFSGDVIFSSEGPFQFTNFVILGDKQYGGGISHWNELVYPAREVLSGTQEHFGFTGNFPVNASLKCYLLNDNYEWAVGVAQANENAIMTFN